MRVVSLVPSWTETLLEAGIEVVGRSRFCIHPKDGVASIPKVGGTKDWDLPRLLALKPDLLILDREENPRFMAEQANLPFWASHINRVSDLAPALEELAVRLGSTRLSALAGEWRALPPPRPPWTYESEAIPGLIEWGARPEQPVRRVLYVIWKDPWMRVGRDTFISSVLEHVGFAPYLIEADEKYPVFDPTQFNPSETLLLFSSEPYPFLRRKKEVASLGLPHAFIDGESYSWFGLRSLRFLQSACRPARGAD